MRFAAFLLLLFIAAAAGSLARLAGFVPDLPLVVLIVAAAFLPVGELVALSLAAAWLMSTGPGLLTGENALLLFLPLFWALAHRLTPAHPWLTASAGSAVAVALFYLVVRGWSVFREPVIGWDVLLGAAAGAILFAVLYARFPLRQEELWR